MASADEIARMSKIERIAEALRRSIPHLPAEGKAMVESMLDPTMLTLIGGTLLVSRPSTERRLCMTSRHALSVRDPNQISTKRARVSPERYSYLEYLPSRRSRCMGKHELRSRGEHRRFIRRRM